MVIKQMFLFHCVKKWIFDDILVCKKSIWSKKWSTAHTDSALSDGVVVKGPPGTTATGQGGVSWWGVEGSALYE